MTQINGWSDPSMLAYQGIQHHLSRVDDNTATIVQPQQEWESTAKALIDNRMAKNDIEALVKVLKTQDNLLGQLFDTWT